MDQLLAGARVLLATADGGDLAPALEAAGATVARAPGAAVPDVIVVAPGEEAAARERLDPLGLPGAPPVVSLAALGDPVAGIRRLIEAAALAARARALEAALADSALGRRDDLEAARLDALHRLALAAEYRDDNTREHTERVAALAARLARALGLEDRAIWLVRQAAPLHDLGKIAVPDSILLKPGPLTPEEFAVVRTHPVAGAAVLAGGEGDLLGTAERIARSHHERWDGGGYPDGLAGEAIPLEARLVHLADVFDVLLHERPYREPLSVDEAVAAVEEGAGADFDPAAVQAFVALGPVAWTAPR